MRKIKFLVTLFFLILIFSFIYPITQAATAPPCTNGLGDSVGDFCCLKDDSSAKCNIGAFSGGECTCDSGLICNQEYILAVPQEPKCILGSACGGVGEHCCDPASGKDPCESNDLICKVDLVLGGNTCQKCGDRTEWCCGTGDPCISPYECQADGRCGWPDTTCGYPGDRCCMSDGGFDVPCTVDISYCFCYGGGICEGGAAVNGCYLPECGKPGQNCCENSSKTNNCNATNWATCYCETGSTCELSANTSSGTECIDQDVCGGLDQVCCASDPVCDGELVCTGGFCKGEEEVWVTPWDYEGPIINNLPELISPIVKILYYAGLVIGVGAIIYSGYLLMVSEGNPQRTEEGMNWLTSAVLGILFILLSVAIFRVILVSLFNSSVGF